MSDAEKREQIGEAMELLEQQKRDFAHLAAKIVKVQRAYQTFGSEVERWRVDTADPKRVYLLHPAPEERDLAASLLGQSDLAQLLTEFKAAEAAFSRTREKLASFGITGLQP
jgi:hypothetical protein